MDPAKSETVTRQSSILKPTKQRQPLQCVASQPGSSESSPTIKIKRRVSFARNKRIREFCNEAEQGTVWDDTYEEHDSSSTKSNSTGGNEPLTITVPCQDKENFPVQLFLQTDQIECKEVAPSGALGEDADNLSQGEMEMEMTLGNPELQNVENATIYGDDGGLDMDMTTYVPSRIIACHNQDTDFLNDKEPMELTENLPLAHCKNSTAHPSSKTELLRNNAVNSTELTVAISQLLAGGNANKRSSSLTNCPNMNFTENTAPMEFTAVLPSSTWIRPDSLGHGDKRTENFDNQTMEFTMAVPQINIRENQRSDKTEDLMGKTKIFANKSMEMTEAIPVQRIVQTRSGVENLAPEMVEEVSTTIGKISNEPLQDKTRIFTDKPIEETVAIPVYIENCKEPQSARQREFFQDKTEIFTDKSIEMTETIPVYVENANEARNKVSSNLEQSKTTIFNNKSMEVTEGIPVYIDDCDQVQSKTLLKARVDKTKIFSDKSMEITEAISNLSRNNERSEKTNVFLDKSMEMTEAVHRQSRPIVERTPDNTIYADKSMEVTGSIPAFYKFHHSNYGNVPNILVQDKTSIYANKSMEMTEAVPSCKARVNDENSLQLPNISATMDMTQAVPCNKIYQSNPKATPGMTKVFADTSMEMTEAVPVRNAHQYREASPREETKIILNESMEMTEAVPNFKQIQAPVFNTEYECSTNAHKIQRKSLPKRRSVYEKPTEITESLASLMTNESALRRQDRTEYFANESMNVTETVPVPQNVVSSSRGRQVTAEKTEFFSDKSMEMTEAIIMRPAPEKTKIFLDKSMDMTETIAVLNSFPSNGEGNKNVTHGGPHFASNDRMSLISKVSTIPKDDSNADYFKSREIVASSQPSVGEITRHDDSMESTGVLLSKDILADRQNSRMGNNLDSSCNDRSRITQNALDTSTNKSRADVGTKLTSFVQPYDSAKDQFANTSMEFTAPAPAIVHGAANLSRQPPDLPHSRSILSARMDPVVQNPVEASILDSHREEMFHRITSDELNSLCASMNLPYQKYSVENVSLQNTSVPACSNVSLLRESLRNGTLFQQPDVGLPVRTPTKIYVPADAEDFEMESCVDATKNHNADLANNSRSNIFSKLARDSNMTMETQRTADISLKRTPLTEMELDKTAEISARRSVHGEPRLPSLSMTMDVTADEIGTKNLQRQFLEAKSQNEIAKIPEAAPHSSMDVSMIREHPRQSTASTAVELRNSVSARGSRIEIYRDVSMEIGAPPHSLPPGIASTSSGKRKSDETCESIAKRKPAVCAVTTYVQATEPSSTNKECRSAEENSLSRLPSDSTEVLLATMGCKAELAYPLIINEKTIIRVSQRAPIDRTYVEGEGSRIEATKSQVEPITNKTYVVGEESRIEAIKSQVEPITNKTYVVGEESRIEAIKSQVEPITNKTYVVGEESRIEAIKSQIEPTTNKTYVVDANDRDQAGPSDEGRHVGIPVVKSPGGGRGPPPAALEQEDNFEDEDKENKEPPVKVNLFVEKYSELEDIEPPSFLGSESMNDDDLSDIVKLPDDDDDDADKGDNQLLPQPVDENAYVPFAELSHIENLERSAPKEKAKSVSENIERLRSRRRELMEELKRLSKSDASGASKAPPSRKVAESREKARKENEAVGEPVAREPEGVTKEPISPFSRLTEDLKTFERRDDCIWSLRMINEKLIAVDFISKSLVLLVRLKKVESIDCMRDIEKIEVVSRLPADSKDTLLKIVHNLLLSKLNLDEMLDRYKLYEDVMPLLTFVSSEVIFAMNFMFDLQRLGALNPVNIDEKKIVFMVASRKANIILKLSLKLKMFNEIGPDDIDVICISGDVRMNDIKQLIVNIKKDYKFLSRYIKDVKDYITLMEESTSLHKF